MHQVLFQFLLPIHFFEINIFIKFTCSITSNMNNSIVSTKLSLMFSCLLKDYVSVSVVHNIICTALLSTSNNNYQYAHSYVHTYVPVFYHPNTSLLH